MKHFHYYESEENKVYDYHSKKTTIRVFIDKNEAPNFIMRRFEIKPGGQIGVHSHPYEHEIYILKGELYLLGDSDKKELVTADEFVYIPPNEPHGYLNEGSKVAAFICVIPKQ
ncbi:MAG: cupin domain-containing protein [Promethearchaeota archaeon]